MLTGLWTFFCGIPTELTDVPGTSQMSRKKSGTCHQQDDKIKVAEIKVFKVNLECNLEQPIRKTAWSFLKKTKNGNAILSSNVSARHILNKTIIQSDTYIPIFITALFTIPKTWKKPKCPSTEEWIKKMQHMYTVEYYSSIKKNKIMPFAATWMELEIIILSKSERERQMSYNITYMYNLKYDTNYLSMKQKRGLSLNSL